MVPKRQRGFHIKGALPVSLDPATADEARKKNGNRTGYIRNETERREYDFNETTTRLRLPVIHI